MPTAAEIINKLNLGTSKQTVAAAIGSPLNTLILGIHQEVIDKLNAKILQYNAVASNRLKQSLVSLDHSIPGKVVIEMTAEFYWKYVNFGVNGLSVNHGAPTWGPPPSGSLPFKDAILGWIKDRGIQAKPGQSYDELAFMIMRHIKYNGIKPRPFFTDVVNKDLEKYLSKSISAVYKKAIIIEIKNPTK